jgi:hypothetical protein
MQMLQAILLPVLTVFRPARLVQQRVFEISTAHRRSFFTLYSRPAARHDFRR